MKSYFLKASFTAALFLSVLIYAFQRSTLVMVAPDSVRFMNFWQLSFDYTLRNGVSPRSILLLIFRGIKMCNIYDLGRGRLVQDAMYGLDGLTRGWLPNPMAQPWMCLVLMANTVLISWGATVSVKDLSQRMTVACLGSAVIFTSAVALAPSLVAVLYGKYLWITFISAFFVARKNWARVSWLALAAYSDEVGLIAVMVIIFMLVTRFVLLSCGQASSSARRLLRASWAGFLAAWVAFFSFYGVISVFFQVGAKAFRVFTTGTADKLVNGLSLLEILNGIFWRVEQLLLGFSLGSALESAQARQSREILAGILGLVVFGLISSGVLRRLKIVLGEGAASGRPPDELLSKWLADEQGIFYSFWLAMFILLALVILPGKEGDFTHYGYPTYAAIAALTLAALVDLWNAKRAGWVLGAILVLHLCVLPHSVRTADEGLGRFLLDDGSVTREDLRAIEQSVVDLRAEGHSSTFDRINNGQEIDYSGTWYYSRLKEFSAGGFGFDSVASEYYLPIEGTVRVLLWPRRIEHPRSGRIFDPLVPKWR